MDHGIGPVCRKLDNAVLARTIPANVAEAMRLAATITEDVLPEPTRQTMGTIVADLVDFTNKDWRKTVKRIEWMLSWGMSPNTNKTLIATVRALGYIGLAALLAGDAATGKTTVTFENGRLYVRGPRNKAGAYQIKRIKSWYFHQAANGLKAAWSVPGSAADALHTVVMTYWPNFEGLDEAVAAAKAAPTAVESTVPAETEAIVVSVTLAGEWLKVRSPYNKGFIDALRMLHYTVRKWNANEKVWEVKASNKTYVENMIAKHYPTAKYVSAAA